MTFEQILKDLKTKYPQVELSFGYIGEVGKGYGTYEDLNWYFFTKVWDHRPNRFYKNCHSFGLGQTARKDSMEKNPVALKEAKRDIIGWIEGVVLPDLGKPCTRTAGTDAESR
ncbi:hypothetical protein N9045_01860 [bacterium]|nr:hypothetical protein [bacterium]